MINKRYHVSGIFSLAVEGKNNLEAKETAARILRCSGIDGIVVEVCEVNKVEQTDTQNHYPGPSGTKRAATARDSRAQGVCIHTARDAGV